MADTTLTYLSTTLTLDTTNSLHWTDEFDWCAVVETVSSSVTGVRLVDRGVRLAGRPITLAGGSDGKRAWGVMPRTKIVTLRTWAQILAFQATLNYRGTAYTVLWDRADGRSPIEATRLRDVANPTDSELYLATLRFVTA